MGVCMLWEAIYMLGKAFAHFPERIDAVVERVCTLSDAADALWKSIYTLG